MVSSVPSRSSVSPAEARRRKYRVVLATIMVGIGLLHFVRPGPFVSIVPSALPAPYVLVIVSGFLRESSAASVFSCRASAARRASDSWRSTWPSSPRTSTWWSTPSFRRRDRRGLSGARLPLPDRAHRVGGLPRPVGWPVGPAVGALSAIPHEADSPRAASGSSRRRSSVPATSEKRFLLCRGRRHRGERDRPRGGRASGSGPKPTKAWAVGCTRSGMKSST